MHSKITRTKFGSRYFVFEHKTVRIERDNDKIVIADRNKIVYKSKIVIKIYEYIYIYVETGLFLKFPT